MPRNLAFSIQRTRQKNNTPPALCYPFAIACCLGLTSQRCVAGIPNSKTAQLGLSTPGRPVKTLRHTLKKIQSQNKSFPEATKQPSHSGKKIQLPAPLTKPTRPPAAFAQRLRISSFSCWMVRSPGLHQRNNPEGSAIKKTTKRLTKRNKHNKRNTYLSVLNPQTNIFK